MKHLRTLLCGAMLAAIAFTGVPGAWATSDDIPGEEPKLYTWMPVVLNSADANANDAVYRVWLCKRDVLLVFSSNGDVGFDLFGPGAVSVDSDTPLDAHDTDEDGFPMLAYQAGSSGTYYADAWAPDGAGMVSDDVLVWPVLFVKFTLNGASLQRTSYAQSAGISCTMRCGDDDPMGLAVPVRVYRSVGGGAWSLRKTLAATDSARKSFAESVKVKTRYKLVVPESDWVQGATSPIKTVYPRVRLTRTTSWTTLAVNRTYYAKGYIEPKHASSDANKVKIRAYKKGSDGKYRYVRSFTASYSYYSASKSRYKASVKLGSKGSWKLVAYHAADTRNAATYGSADYVTVK